MNSSVAAVSRGFLRTNRYLLGVALVVCVAAAGAGIQRQLAIRKSAANAAALPEPERTHVHALGRLEPAGTILQLTPRSGNEGATVERLFVNEGDDVTSGTLLAVLDNQTKRQAALQEANARLAAAEARQLQIQAGAKVGDIEAQAASVRLFEEQSRFAYRDLQRAMELRKRNAIGEEQLDQKQWEYDRLLLEHRRGEGLLQSLKEVRTVDVNVAEKDVLAARAHAAAAQTDVEASEVRAPISGRILRIDAWPGERFSDRGIMEIANVREMQAVAEVFEGDIGRLKLGMEAEVRLDSSAGVFTGKVCQIGNAVARRVVLTNDPVSDTDARVVEVRVQLSEQDPEFLSRLSNARVEVHIDLRSSHDETPGTENGFTEVSGTPEKR
jgi:HlyD family secretion protein